MKKRLPILISCLAACILLSSLRLKAQQRIEPIPCYEPKVSKEKIQQMLQYRKQGATNLTTASKKQLRIYFHICRNDNGSNPGATTAEIDTEFQTLLSDFTQGDICFVNAGFNFINNTVLNNIDVDKNDDAEDLFEARTIPGCLNVFFTYQIKGKNNASGGKIGGLAFNVPGTFCLVGKNYLGRHTTSHEIGHCLGLFHTFSSKGLGLEMINGDNCSVAGDLICDTKADPYAYNEESCYSDDGNGFYDGNCEDPKNGSKNFSPPYTNVMSYWHHAPETFTSAQFTAMRSTIDNEDDIENVASSQTVTIMPVTYLVEFIYKSAIDKLQTIGPVEFAAASNGGLFGSQVLLTPGFYAHPQVLPVRIAATSCNSSSFAPIASVTGATNTATAAKISTGNNAGNLIVFPNPATQYFNIQYSKPGMFDAVVTVRNANGVIIFSSNRKNVLKLQERVDLTGKPKGIYFVQVNAGGKYLTATVIAQ